MSADWKSLHPVDLSSSPPLHDMTWEYKRARGWMHFPLWNNAVVWCCAAECQFDDVHVTCLCLHYSPRTEIFPLVLFFLSFFLCFLVLSIVGLYLKRECVCVRCLLSLMDDERRDAVSLQSGPLICLSPLAVHSSLTHMCRCRHTRRHARPTTFVCF